MTELHELAAPTLRLLNACDGDIEKAKPALEAMGRADAIVELAMRDLIAERVPFSEVMRQLIKYIRARELLRACELTGLDEYEAGQIYGYGFGLEVGKAFAR